jgi:UDP-N-acetylmuramoyl-L-alanyl-D-glutamate--2,6-diaminopimelate ligase
MKIVGITGTNGKTTTAWLVEWALRNAGMAVGSVGTLGIQRHGERHPSGYTTPPWSRLRRTLDEMRAVGTDVVAMEVTSIGLDRGRVDAVAFDVGVFTNIDRDHVDYHGSLDAYRRSKARLFTELLRAPGGPPRALMCADDPAWPHLGPPRDRWLYGFAPRADIRICDVKPDRGATLVTMTTPYGAGCVRSTLFGRHNATNLAAALGCCLLLGVGLEDALEGLSLAPLVPGRLECVDDTADVKAYVDYAHTPGALEAALTAVRSTTRGELWVVFGCGGGRDRGKRPEMGRVAECFADQVVLTSDNPRHEPPVRIAEHVLSGMRARPTRLELDRARAIDWTVRAANEGDVVLIAGRGHEPFQITAHGRTPLDDCNLTRRALSRRRAGPIPSPTGRRAG